MIDLHDDSYLYLNIKMNYNGIEKINKKEISQ